MAKARSAPSPRQTGSSRLGGLQKKLPETLKGIAREFPQGTRFPILFQDEGRFGRISDGRSCWAPPSNMTLVPLPSYSPELNPSEHVWDYIRENDMRNLVFPDLDKVMDAVETSLHHLHGSPDLLRSMTAFPWIIESVA